MTCKPTRRVIADRRKNPRSGRSGRRATDNQEEREFRVAQLVEYLRRQNEQISVDLRKSKSPKG